MVGRLRSRFENSINSAGTLPEFPINIVILTCFTQVSMCFAIYRGADKSLARPGRKQATATEDFDVHVSYL